MHVKIRIRYIHILFTKKEFKILLVPCGTDEYTFPILPNPAPFQDQSQPAEVLDQHQVTNNQFIGLADRIPVLMHLDDEKHLALDYYILNRVKIRLATPESGRWFDLQQAQQLNPEIAAVITKTLQKLREELNYQPIEYHLLQTTFSMSELQRLYELLLDKRLDRGNFSKKIISLDILNSSFTKRKVQRYKAPTLFRFNKNYFDKKGKGMYKTF